jgi:hypothetical protein
MPTPTTTEDLPPPVPHRNYRPAVVAAYTGLSERQIRYGCERGEIRHVRHGRAITIPGSEILRLNGQAEAA